MEFRKLAIDGLVEITPKRLGDARGYFAETFRADRFAAEIGVVDFVQENQSLSARIGTVRGLHFQSAPCAQGKLVRCLAGAVFDVAVDLRHGSASFSQWLAVELTEAKGNQLWVPAGFAHGFCTLTPDAVLGYRVSGYYSAEHDKGVAWDDPAIGIDWPDCVDADSLSAKDRVQPKLAELPAYFSMESK